MKECVGEMVDIVDMDDIVVATKPREQRAGYEITRTSVLWLTDMQDKILLAKRQDTKQVSPGKRSVAVAETVQAGETYLDALIRGAHEEVSLSVAAESLSIGPKILSQHAENNSFKQIYYARCSDEQISSLHPDPAEVQEIRWFTSEEVAVLLNESPHMFSRSFADIYDTRMGGHVEKNIC